MNSKLNFDQLRPAQTVAAATLATVIGISSLWAVASLFQSRGQPFEQLAVAERACAHHAHRSEQQACIERFVAEQKAVRVAKH